MRIPSLRWMQLFEVLVKWNKGGYRIAESKHIVCSAQTTRQILQTCSIPPRTSKSPSSPPPSSSYHFPPSSLPPSYIRYRDPRSLLHPSQAGAIHHPRRDVRALVVLRRFRSLRRIARHARRSVFGRGHCDSRGDEVGFRFPDSVSGGFSRFPSGHAVGKKKR